MKCVSVGNTKKYKAVLVKRLNLIKIGKIKTGGIMFGPGTVGC